LTSEEDFAAEFWLIVIPLLLQASTQISMCYMSSTLRASRDYLLRKFFISLGFHIAHKRERSSSILFRATYLVGVEQGKLANNRSGDRRLTVTLGQENDDNALQDVGEGARLHAAASWFGSPEAPPTIRDAVSGPRFPSRGTLQQIDGVAVSGSEN